jgi:phosphopantothenoylcysteine decarboxylase / phosphopantothenate---cysteine ligase
LGWGTSSHALDFNQRYTVIGDEKTRRLLITAGPTYEPIDAVRFIGNRSSGRLGSALADYAQGAGWEVTLLLGPNAVLPEHPGVEIVRFESTRDLQSLLGTQLPLADVLIMAAAVADYRPVQDEIDLTGKRRRAAGHLALQLESTPDLLAGCSKNAREDQLLVGFALEPKAELMASAQRKLGKKNIDLIVANALETMDSDSIEATLIGNGDRGINYERSTPGVITKVAFAAWLIEQLVPLTNLQIQTKTGTTTNG